LRPSLGLKEPNRKGLLSRKYYSKTFCSSFGDDLSPVVLNTVPKRTAVENARRLNPTIEELTMAVEQKAKKRPQALRLMTHPSVEFFTALASVLIRGTA
jgi:hypothetical protein